MIATSDLLEQIKGLKARISRLGPTPGGVTLANASLLTAAAKAAAAPNSTANKEPKESKANGESPLRKDPKEFKDGALGTTLAASVTPPVPFAIGNMGKLGWRARRILETGLDLTSTLKQWQDRGERNEPGLDLVLNPEEFSETVALADGSLRLLGLFPEAQTEQHALCEGLEIVLVHLRRRVAFWEKKWELVRAQQSGVRQLMRLAEARESSPSATQDLLQSWRDCAGEMVSQAKKTGLGHWIDRSGKDPLTDWAESTGNLCDLTARFGLHLGLSEKETRSLVLGALFFHLVHAQMPGYLHGKAVWDENDRGWYAQWHRNQIEELPEPLKPWALKEALSAEQKSILELLARFNALQMSRPDRPGMGPLAALIHLEKNQVDFSEAHWRSLASFLEKEGTLIEAGSLGAALIWSGDSGPKPSSNAVPVSREQSKDQTRDQISALRALILGPIDAGSTPSQGPYWVSLAGGIGGAVKELTGSKRARWHIQLLAGAADYP